MRIHDLPVMGGCSASLKVAGRVAPAASSRVGMMSPICMSPLLMLPFSRLTTGPLTTSALRMPPSATQPLYWLNGVIDTCAHIGP